MSSKKDPRFSRRGFIRGAGIGSGVLGAGLLEKEAQAAPPATAIVGPGPVPITLHVNGKPVNVSVEPAVTLCDALRDYLDLTGAKRVCDRGTCGACTVIMDGKSVYSCSILAVDAQGKKIETIESLGGPDRMHPISAAFWNHDAQQCGYCTPGFVMATRSFLEEHPNPTLEEVKRGLGGNLCRCGTYVGIRKAVLEAAAAMKGEKKNA